jgi:L-iditol 2-dehydrogenase
MKMKVANLVDSYKFQLEEWDKPVPGKGQVLVKVSYAGICGSDFAIYTGEGQFVKKGMIKYPIVMGHEWSGVIEEVGEDCAEFKTGDAVVGDGEVACGTCPECMRGRFPQCHTLRGVGTIDSWDGAYADYILMPERHVHRIPEGVDMREAALVEPAAIAMKSVKNGMVKTGDTVLVQGTGPIGLSSVRLSVVAGASKVILAGRKDSKLSRGKEMGADHTVNVTKEDLETRVQGLTGGRGVDVVIEASGAESALKQAFRVVKGGGVLSLPAFYEKPVNNIDLDDLIFKNVLIAGVCGGQGYPCYVLDLMKNGRISLDPQITDEYPLSKVTEAMEAMTQKNDTRIKILLKP